MQQTEIFLIIGIVFLGCIATVAYYLARYYFKIDKDDQDVIPSLRKEEIKGHQSQGETSQDLIQSESKTSLDQALSQTKSHFWGRIKKKFSSDFLSSENLESLEEILYTSDLGPQTVQQLISTVEEKLESSQKNNLENVRDALRKEMLQIFSDQPEVKEISSYFLDSGSNNSKDNQIPQVWMVVGVNGAGKTTTIGKLANQASQLGKKVMVVAGDTFRAAADSQLKVWGERAGVEIFSPANVKDPSAVVFDALSKGQSQSFDLIIIDTAGRLHTQDHLMNEIKKVKRVMAKVIPEAPQETIIVLDANSGQNALVQARMFHEALGLTGAIVTKLDGSAKGGVVLGLVYELGLSIKMIGIGEKLDDLRPFSSKDFVDSIL